MENKWLDNYSSDLKSTITQLNKKFNHRRFTKYIKGKNVIIVGPDPRMKGTGLGPTIDKFQTIIRLNTTFDFIPFTPTLAKDIGSRTDVIYLCPSSIRVVTQRGKISSDRMVQRKVKNQLIKSGVKFINYQNGNEKGKYLSGEYVYQTEIKSLKKFLVADLKIRSQLHSSHESCLVLNNLMGQLLKLLKKIKQQSIEINQNNNSDSQWVHNLPQELFESNGHVPRTGFLAIFDALVHGANSITIEGMSFYHGGGHMFRPDVKGELNPLKNHADRNSHHNSILEVVMLKILMNLYPKQIIIQSPYLQEVLNTFYTF